MLVPVYRHIILRGSYTTPHHRSPSRAHRCGRDFAQTRVTRVLRKVSSVQYLEAGPLGVCGLRGESPGTSAPCYCIFRRQVIAVGRIFRNFGNIYGNAHFQRQSFLDRFYSGWEGVRKCFVDSDLAAFNSNIYSPGFSIEPRTDSLCKIQSRKNGSFFRVICKDLL